MQRDYNNPDLKIWYIKNKNDVIAVMMLKIIDETTGKIENVCCRRDFRGKGLSQKIFDEIITFSKNNRLKRIKLGTYESLERAIGFYLKNGFVENIEKRNLNNNSRFFEKILE